MKRLFHIAQADTPVHLALLLLRVVTCIFMIHHGYTMMNNFSEMQEKFISFIGLSGSISLCLTIFAEFFCSLVLLFGFLSRMVLIQLIITMLVAIIVAHKGVVFGDGEHAALFLLIYIALLITGPGRYSVDSIFSKHVI